MNGIFNATIFNPTIFNVGVYVPPGTIYYQGDGKRRTRRRRRQEELFTAIESTLHELFYGIDPSVAADAVQATLAPVAPDRQVDVESAYATLAKIATDNAIFEQRLSAIRTALAAYQAEKNRQLATAREQDDEEVMLML